MEKKNKYLCYRTLKLLLRVLFLFLFRPTIEGKENIPQKEGVILAGNHRKAMDPAMIAISTSRVVRFLAKKELHEGILGIFFKGMATIPVERTKKDQSIMKITTDILNKGEIISLFPEGKRNRTEEVLLPFKYGAVAMAQRSNSIIVPFAITGEYKLFKKSIKIKFGKAIDLSDVEAPKANEHLREKVRELILTNLER